VRFKEVAFMKATCRRQSSKWIMKGLSKQVTPSSDLRKALNFLGAYLYNNWALIFITISINL